MPITKRRSSRKFSGGRKAGGESGGWSRCPGNMSSAKASLITTGHGDFPHPALARVVYSRTHSPDAEFVHDAGVASRSGTDFTRFRRSEEKSSER